MSFKANLLGGATVLAALLCGQLAFASESPLADAAEHQNEQAIRELIKQKADVNTAQVDGMTALLWAAYHDDFEMAQWLIDAGADVTATNLYGIAPLTLACVNGNTGLVELLLDSDADPNTTRHGGETALMTAARTGKVGPVKVLLEHGAEVDSKERNDQTAIMWAAAEGYDEVVQLLIDAGADFRTPLPSSGFTSLFLAVREGHSDVVKTLLAAGIDVNEAITTRRGGATAPRRGMSPLLMAVENGHFELAVELIDLGSDPNDQRSGFTPLHNITWVRKPNLGEDEDGDPPPQGSGEMTSLQFVHVLVARGADVNARLERGPSGPEKMSYVGATAFLLASSTADLLLLKLLVELGADPLLGNEDGCTPLMAVAGVGTKAAEEVAGTEPEALEVAAYLLELGADVNTIDANGETAIHGAAYKNFPNMIRFLYKHGASAEIINHRNKRERTPLHIANGYRLGNFKPAAETIQALHEVMLASGFDPSAEIMPKKIPNYSN